MIACSFPSIQINEILLNIPSPYNTVCPLGLLNSCKNLPYIMIWLVWFRRITRTHIHSRQHEWYYPTDCQIGWSYEATLISITVLDSNPSHWWHLRSNANHDRRHQPDSCNYHCLHIKGLAIDQYYSWRWPEWSCSDWLSVVDFITWCSGGRVDKMYDASSLLMLMQLRP